MNTENFTNLLQRPDKVVSPVQTKQLEEILEEFPYFQTARALHLKGLKNLNSFKYNKALKITAAYTADREVLFDLITSKEFLQNNIADSLAGKSTKLVDTETDSEEVIPQPSDAANTKSSASTHPGNLENASSSKEESPSKNASYQEEASQSENTSLSLSKEEAEALLDPELFTAKDASALNPHSKTKKKISEELEIGQPLPFSKREKYSFGEWLKLTNFKPIRKSKKSSSSKDLEIGDIQFPLEEENPKRQKQSDLIDRFIAENPKIKPQKDVPKIAIGNSVKFDQKELMTETLAKVYLEQKKYKKAIQAYKILSLKYPEKSGFFADRIKAVERLKDGDLPEQ